MSNFLIFEEESGEIVFIRRDTITSLKPSYVRKFCYRILATVGKESYVIHESASLQEAKDWCLEQIRLIDGATGTGNTSSGVDLSKPTNTANNKLQ